MRIGKYNFQPRVVPSLVTLVLLPVLISLGFWQLNRAEQKFAGRDVREQRAALAPKALRATDVDPQAMVARQVEARGRFDLRHQFLLQNQRYRERPGYQVYTPLRLDQDTGVLVDRGWVAAHFGRDQPEPDLRGAGDEISVVAVVDNPPSIGLKLGEPGAGSRDWPRQVQYIDFAWAERQLGYRLLPYVLLPSQLPEQNLVQNHQPERIGERGMPPEKHVSYAVQWFALALGLVVIYFVVNLSRIGGRTDNDR